MKRWKNILVAALMVPGLLAFPGCASLETEDYVIPAEKPSAGSGVVAQNAAYQLEWDDQQHCALLRDRATDYVWSTTPYGAYREGSGSVALNSALTIEYYDLTDLSVQSDKSYIAVEEGNSATETVENGVRITYYFPQAEITVPLTLTLEETGLRATVKAADIVESGKTRLMSVSLLPYLCSAQKTTDRTAYLMVPTGSGALMYTDDDRSANGRAYSGEVYGTDAARLLLHPVENEEAICLPVFGAKTDAQNALFAVIDQGAGAAWIEALAGNSRYDYANVYARFLYRGYDEMEYSSRWESKALSAGCKPDAVYSVCYYPLAGEQADYTGMAQLYRQYLRENGQLQKSAAEQKAYQVTLIGGVETRQFFLGIPYERVTPLTPYSQAKTLLSELTEATGAAPAVLLKGYGESGVSLRKVGGGFGFAGAMGRRSEREALLTYCRENDIPAFLDYELNRFTQSGSGFRAIFDTAKTAVLQAAAAYPLKRNIRSPDDSYPKIRLLKRALLPTAVEKVLKAVPETAEVSLGSLGACAYSDYTQEETYLRGNIETQVPELIRQVQERGKAVALRSANGYAAGVADTVFEVPVQNGHYASFDENIPFYQMVFRGSVPLYTTPVNYAADTRAFLLDAVEAGVSPGFALTGQHVPSLTTAETDDYFYAAEYSGQKETLVRQVAETKAYFAAIGSAEITAHALLDGGVTKTEFANGVTVLVNHGDTAQTVEGHTVAAQSYVFTGGAS